MTVRYSPRAAKALARLKQHNNDLDIFVEDTSNHNMWVFFLRSILPAGTKLKSVNQLGGRDRVVEACKRDQTDDGRRKLYIIDGDFDHILHRPKPNLLHLYRLKAYCIENLLMSREAVIKVGSISQPDWSEKTISSNFSFSDWYTEVSEDLGPLFVIYAAAHLLTPTVQTTAYPVSSLYRNAGKKVTLCKTKVKRRIISVVRSILKEVAKNELRTTILELANRANRRKLGEFVSGKDYLLPLFTIQMNNRLSYRGTSEQLKVLLAHCCSPQSEPLLARRLAKLCA